MSEADTGTGSGPTREQLPLPDYDHLPLGSVESRIRSLSAEDVSVLLAYEREHGARLPVVQVLEARLDALRNGAEPSEGSPLAATPEAAPAPAGTSAAAPATAGPVINPPSHGDPTNPAQPRSTG